MRFASFHKMLDEVGLIHMGGRVYDPGIGRFVSADPIIQAPLNSQSYNRYSYVWNNPLSNTDPSGFVTNRDDGCNGSDTGPECSTRAQFEMKKCQRQGLDCKFKKDGQGQWRAVGTTHSLITVATARAAGVIAGYVEPDVNMGNFDTGAQVSETTGDTLSEQESEALAKEGVGNNQEKKGTIKYNKPPPNTVPVEGKTEEALQCFVNTCLPGKVLSVTGGQEKYDANGKLLHSMHSTHYPENGATAVDISTWRENNSELTTNMVNQCALACGFTHGQLETGHWHLQIGPGNGSLPLPMED